MHYAVDMANGPVWSGPAVHQPGPYIIQASEKRKIPLRAAAALYYKISARGPGRVVGRAEKFRPAGRSGPDQKITSEMSPKFILSTQIYKIPAGPGRAEKLTGRAGKKPGP